MGNRFSRTISVVLLFGALAVQSDARGASLQRGEDLYLNHCLACHESTAHIRENRRAKNLGEVRRWVARWSLQLELGWGQEEVKDVSAYLNRTYYRFGDISLAR